MLHLTMADVNKTPVTNPAVPEITPARPDLITPQTLRLIVPALTADRSVVISKLLNEICPRYGITDADMMHEFIATLAHESDSFKRKEENLNYKAARLLKVFPKYFKQSEAARYAGKPIAIASRVYANRMGNGNEATQDGWKYRGGGFIQVTGKDMYMAYARYTKVDISASVDLIRTTDYHAMNSACWVFSIVKGLNAAAKDDKFEEITRRINGGLNGMPDRLAFYNRARTYLK